MLTLNCVFYKALHFHWIVFSERNVTIYKDSFIKCHYFPRRYDKLQQFVFVLVLEPSTITISIEMETIEIFHQSHLSLSPSSLNINMIQIHNIQYWNWKRNKEMPSLQQHNIISSYFLMIYCLRQEVTEIWNSLCSARAPPKVKKKFSS